MQRVARLRAVLLASAMTGLLCGGVLVTAGPAVAVPGDPGVPQAPAALVYYENFENMDATASAINLPAYQGGPAAANQTYVADANWKPAAGQCNGWVLRSNTPRSSVANRDAGCDATAWAYLQGDRHRAVAR